MNILHTTLLQRLVQACNSLNINTEAKEKDQLDLLIHLMKMVRAQENVIEEFSRQDIALHTVEAPA